MNPSAVLIVGGAGYIGSHIAKMLWKRGYRTLVFDSLSLGNQDAVKYSPLIQGNLSDVHALDQLFDTYPIQAVIHCAALIDVGESVVHPAEYYLNNVTYTLNLLNAMRNHGVTTLIFSSSAAIFGMPQHPKIDESHPCNPINPYGKTKLVVEGILRDYDTAYGLKSTCVRYFNAAGGDPDGEIKDHKLRTTNLIPILIKTLQQKTPITIFGTDYPTLDGTCIRDYVHIEDLGEVHIRAMEKLLQEKQSTHYNLGNGNGFSVKQVISAAEKVTGLKANIIEGPRRAGDPPILVADSKKAREELDWHPQYAEIETMIAHAWNALN